ncbi:MAG: flavocytochrome c [Synergistaceae bacterium]|nr:flavocytochrome c [Synergistaceae bacterium]
MKKRVFIIVSIIAIALIIYTTAAASKGVLTGTGKGDGFAGKDAITVTISLKDGKITEVTAEGPGETPGIGSKAIESMPGLMVEKNSITVDGVTGATMSTGGILQAAENAIKAAGLNPEDYKTVAKVAEAPKEEKPVEAPKVEKSADGSTAIGKGDGFSGKDAITVTLTVKDGKIVDAKAEGKGETQGIGSVAVEKLPAEMVAKNSIKVDGITGATLSSNGIMQAAANALTALGLNPEDYKKDSGAEYVPVEKTIETDIAVIGAGGAGMVAAITAADAGKKVIILEKQAMTGGNSVRATGGMNAAHTTEQPHNKFTENAGVEKTLKTAEGEKWKDHKVIQDLAKTVKAQWEEWQKTSEGYFDSAELMELDTLLGGHGINNPELVKALCENTAEAITWLKTIDIDLTSVGAAGGASVKRIHRPLDENKKVLSVGAYMIPRLEAACKARENVELMTETKVESIMTDKDGKVCGVVAKAKNGDTLKIISKAVIIAAGGFGANLKMVAWLKPELEGFMTTNAPGAMGEGIVMAQELGAATVDMKQIQIHPTVQFDSSNLITEGLRGDGAILVNINGKRFIDEVLTRDVVSAAEIAQPSSFAWLIIDQKMVDDSNVIKGYINKGYTFKGDTYEALAKEINIPAEAFAETMKKWNEYVANKNDPEFGRTSFIDPLDKAPFYAIKVTPGIHHTMGGLKIDKDTHVLKGDGTIIPGLFAAGEVTGGVHGGNRLGGTAVADFVVFGRIAGKNAANF